MWLRGGIIFVLSLGVGATPFLGQTETQEQSEQVEVQESETVQTAIRPTKVWSVSARYSGAYSTNPELTLSNSDQSDLSNRIGASLSFTRLRERNSLSLSANAGAQIYTNISNLSNYNFSVNLQGTQRVSPRAALSFGQSLSRSLSYESTLLTDQGILLPAVLTISSRSNVEISKSLSQRTSIGGSFKYEDIRFDDPTFPDASFASGGVQLTRRFNMTDAISLSYGYSRSTSSGRHFDNHSGYGGWSRTLTRRYSLSLAGGVTRSSTPEFSEPSYSISASAALASQIQNGTLTIAYTRSVLPAYGLGGGRLSDVASVRYGQSFADRLNLSGGFTYGLSHELGGEPFDFRTLTLTGSASYQVIQDISLGSGYTYQRLKDVLDPSDVLVRNYLSFFVSYGRRWQ